MTEKIFANYIHVFESDKEVKPVFLEMPHSGLVGFQPTDIIPAPLVPKVNLDSEEFRRAVGAGCDASVPEITGFRSLIEELGLFGISNNLARVLCDTNRDIGQVSDWIVEGGKKGDHHHGVVWSSTPLANIDINLSDDQLKQILLETGERILKEPLTRSEFDALMNEVYKPYHAHIISLHEKIISKCGFFIHLALHSMPPYAPKKICGAYIMGKKATRGPFDPANNTLPDVILIHNDYKAANKVMIDVLKHAFKSEGLLVEDGKGPFLGDIGLTKIYGDAVRGKNVIGIEHVAHDLEPERHLGNPEVNLLKARKLQKAYRNAVKGLLEL